MKLYRQTMAVLAPAAVLLTLSIAPVAAQTPGAAAGAATQQPRGNAAPTQSSVGTPSQAGPQAGANAFTTENVTAANPFGQLDTKNAGNTSSSVGTWAQGLSAAQRDELKGRCNVITEANNRGRYGNEAMQLCQNYASTSEANPATRTP